MQLCGEILGGPWSYRAKLASKVGLDVIMITLASYKEYFRKLELTLYNIKLTHVVKRMKIISLITLTIIYILFPCHESKSISLGRHTNDCRSINQHIINNLRTFYDRRAHESVNILFIGDGGVVYNCFNINEQSFNIDLISDRASISYINRLHTWGCHIEFAFNELGDVIWYIYIKDNTDSDDADSCMVDFMNVYRMVLSDEDPEHEQ